MRSCTSQEGAWDQPAASPFWLTQLVRPVAGYWEVAVSLIKASWGGTKQVVRSERLELAQSQVGQTGVGQGQAWQELQNLCLLERWCLTPKIHLTKGCSVSLAFPTFLWSGIFKSEIFKKLGKARLPGNNIKIFGPPGKFLCPKLDCHAIDICPQW